MRVFSIDAPGGRVSGFELGDGPPLVLIAGLGATCRIWGSLPELLGRQFRVIAVDNRGVGGSRAGEPFTLAGAANDLRAVLDDRGVARTAVFGASMGGLIALLTALELPDRISRVAVASAAAHLSTHGRRILELVHDLLLYAPPERIGADLMTLAFSPPFHERFPGFVVETAALYGLDETDLPGTLLQVEHLLGGWDIRPQLRSLEIPTLVFCGDRDPVIGVEDTLELAVSLPDAEIVRFPDGAHSLLAEGGETALDRLIPFLSGKTEPGGSAFV